MYLKNIVKLGGPRSSIYKYDFKNYLEFVIVDKKEINRTKEWYYHGDSEVNIYGCDGGSHYALEFFSVNTLSSSAMIGMIMMQR